MKRLLVLLRAAPEIIGFVSDVVKKKKSVRASSEEVKEEMRQSRKRRKEDEQRTRALIESLPDE